MKKRLRATKKLPWWVPVRAGCRDAALVIDRFDLWRNGGYAVWVSDKQIEITSVRAARGDRLWSALPERRAARHRRDSGRLRRVNTSASTR